MFTADVFFYIRFSHSSVTLGQSSLDCKANFEQYSTTSVLRSVKIYEPLDIEVKKPRICGRHIMRDNVEDYFRKSILNNYLFSTMR